MTRSLIVIVMLLALSACSARPASDLYVLRVPESLTMPGGKTRGALVVERPSTRAEYDTKRIAVMQGAHKLTYYTGANWASPLPDQVRSFLIDALIQSPRYTSVNDGADNAEARYHLQITIHDASVINPESPQVHLRLSGVMHSPQGHAVKRFTVDETVAATANHMTEIIDAFNEAAANAAETIAAQ